MPWWFRTILWALLVCFLAGLLLGTLIWWWRQRRANERYEQLRLDREAESDRLRLRISALQSHEDRTTELEAEVVDLRDRAELLSAIQGQFSDAQSTANRVPELERHVADLRHRADQSKRLETENRNLRRQVDVAQARAGGGQEAVDIDDELRNLSAELERAGNRIGELEAELERCRAEREVAGAAGATSTNGGELADPGAESWQEGVTVLGTPGANHRDDLKVINGIGPVMERLLNDLGVQTWEQIAAFTEADIEKLSASISSFSGRIERDDWIGGAKELLADGHVPGEDTSARALSSFRRKRS